MGTRCLFTTGALYSALSFPSCLLTTRAHRRQPWVIKSVADTYGSLDKEEVTIIPGHELSKSPVGRLVGDVAHERQVFLWGTRKTIHE
jgi:hypothetical protein